MTTDAYFQALQALNRAREIMKDARNTGFDTDWIDFNQPKGGDA